MSEVDPGWEGLRAAVVTMASVLASYGCALLLERLAGLTVETVIAAVVLAVPSSRVLQRRHRGGLAVALVTLPLAAVCAAGIGRTLHSGTGLGDVLFVLVAAGSVAVRQFGPAAARVGTLTVVPLVSSLVVDPGPGAGRALWAGVAGLVACCWGTLLPRLAERVGLLRRTGTAALAAAPARRAGRRVAPADRLALHMALALTAAFVVGRALWPGHWNWVVLTAFIVCSGARGRGDVVLKGVERAVGAAAGTLLALPLAAPFGPGESAPVVLIFVVMALATWLRSVSYAYWAGGATAMLSLLYGWLGQDAADVLATRLAAITTGAALGMAASCLVLPLRTRDVLRARTAPVLAALDALLAADWADGRSPAHARDLLAARADDLEAVARPLRAHRALRSRWRPGAPHRADAVDAVGRLGAPVAALARLAAAHPSAASEPPVAAALRGVRSNTAAVRRALGARPGAPYRPGAVPSAGAARGPAAEALAALARIDAELAVCAGVFGPPPAPPRGTGGGVEVAVG
ncbi:FUSC family protein [Streptomyces sp. NPDC050560]|uniref:FUSC family protein n=1 Tax=Streptomyces sp. NPDC050560 TaxID=3365630 RepID=UPI00379F5951